MLINKKQNNIARVDKGMKVHLNFPWKVPVTPKHPDAYNWN